VTIGVGVGIDHRLLAAMDQRMMVVWIDVTIFDGIEIVVGLWGLI
jgi:hypothetical protein